MQNQNPMQMMQQLNQFMNNYKGNPEQEAKKLIAQSGLNQKQLNALQSMANTLYDTGKQMGFIK